MPSYFYSKQVGELATTPQSGTNGSLQLHAMNFGKIFSEFVPEKLTSRKQAMRPQNEILDRGYKALVDALGVIDAIRFIHHFSPGYGNYTKERHEWLDKLSINDFLAEMQKHKGTDDKNDFEEVIE
jgi:hypothetical protein